MAEANAEKIAQPDRLEAAVDEAIATCDGDVRAALRATIVANSFLTAEIDVRRAVQREGHERPDAEGSNERFDAERFYAVS